MAPSFHLDHFTLLVCGNALLLAMALTLAAVTARRGDTARALHIWISSLLLFLVPGTLFLLELQFTLPAWFPPEKAAVAGSVASFTVMQQLAVQQMSRGNVTWKEVFGYCFGILVLITCAAWLIPTPSARGVFIGMSRAFLPIFAVIRLIPLLRGSRGARVLLFATLWGSVAAFAVPMIIGNTSVLIPATVDKAKLLPIYAMCADISSVFIGTLGVLLWHQEHIEQRLAQTAMTDALTGVLNRHGLMPRLEQELARAERSGRPISVMLCDLDHFKRVNDRHGHATGDAVLQQFAQRACSLIRRHDVFGRWGGEEFLLILPETTLEQAIMAAERLRIAQAEAEDNLPQVTVSAGVVSAPREGWGFCTAAELLASADHLLYAAKETRNRVVSLASLPPGATTSMPPLTRHEEAAPPATAG